MVSVIWNITTVVAILAGATVVLKSLHWTYQWARRIDDTLSYVKSEMSYNGGSTMRDAVRRIEGRLETIETNQSDVAAELHRFQNRTDPDIRSIQQDVDTLLEHDAERDVAGKRFGVKLKVEPEVRIITDNEGNPQ